MEKNQTENEISIHEIVDNLTLMDDDLMSRVFDDNIPATQLLLHTILDRDDIKIISVTGQMEMKNPIVGGRTIRLDIVAQEESGEMCDIEVQRQRAGAHPRRARFHSSMLDSRMLKAGEKFQALHDSYTIFIIEEDYFGNGLPVYSIERQVKEKGIEFGDGSHIIYVNGAYEGDDSLGRLMKDFKCRNSDDIYYSELAQGVRHFKEGEGRKMVCEAVENYAKKYAAKIEAEKAKVEAEKEKIEAEKEKAEAEKEKAEAEIEILRARLAKYEKV